MQQYIDLNNSFACIANKNIISGTVTDTLGADTFTLSPFGIQKNAVPVVFNDLSTAEQTFVNDTISNYIDPYLYLCEVVWNYTCIRHSEFESFLNLNQLRKEDVIIERIDNTSILHVRYKN